MLDNETIPKLAYGVAAGATTSTTMAVSENLIIACLTVFLAIIGWFIKTTFDSFRSTLREQNKKLDDCIIGQTEMKESIRYTNMNVEKWHKDRGEVFERLRKLENFSAAVRKIITKKS